jgi:hypothetical protein
VALATQIGIVAAPPSRPGPTLTPAVTARPPHEIHAGCALEPGDASPSAPSLTAVRVALVGVALAPLLAIAFPTGWQGASDLPLGVRDTAALLWILCFLPAWSYLREPASRRRPIPILPIMGIEYGMYYALSPLLGLHNVTGVWDTGRMIEALDPARDYALPLRLALGGWVAILAGYAFARQLPLPGVRASERIGQGFDHRTLVRIGFRLVAFGLGFEILRWTEEVPLTLHGTLHFLARVTIIGLALLYALRARRALTVSQRRLLALCTALVIAIAFGTGATYNVILVVFFAFMGGWIGRPRAGLGIVLGGLVSLAIFVSIRGVMIDYRRLTWWSGVEYPLPERSRMMLRLLGDKLEALGPLGTVDDGIHKVAERSANIDILADVVRRTPFQIAFWDGETYRSLVGLAVPRFLWPDKPVKNLGQDFGHRYQYLAPNDRYTQINLPVLVEFYANFGVLGVFLGSLLAGFVYQVVERYVNRPRQAMLVSIGALSLLQPILILEFDFSMQLGGLFLNAVALLGLYVIIQRSRDGHPSGARQSITSPRLTPAVTASVRVETRSFV